MKTKYLLIFISASTLCWYACKKDGNSTSSITGKWSVVSDSTFVGVGAGNHPVDYAGQAGDYFDFRTDGNIYTKEGTVLDTLNYKLVSDNTLIIESFGATFNGVPATSTIKTRTANSLVIVSPRVFTPGGATGRTVHLKR